MGAGHHTWRDCFFDPARTIQVFIMQVLHKNTAMTDLSHKLGFEISPSTYCEARQKLPVTGVAKLVESSEEVIA